MVKKIKQNLFREVDVKLKGVEMAALALVCVIVFGVSFSAIGKSLYDYSQKKGKSVLSSGPEIQIVKSAIAAEDQENVIVEGTGDDLQSEKNIEIEVTPAEIEFEKKQADQNAVAKKIVHQRATQVAIINSAPVLAGRTDKLPDGLRECPVKSLHPQRGGKTHIDEDCCADYNEYPNPRCYYPPNKLAILKKQ